MDLNTPSRVTLEVSVHCLAKLRPFLNKNTLEVLNISYPTGFININLLSLKEYKLPERIFNRPETAQTRQNPGAP